MVQWSLNLSMISTAGKTTFLPSFFFFPICFHLPSPRVVFQWEMKEGAYTVERAAA